MSKISKFLVADKYNAHEIGDDDQIREFLIEFGLSSQFKLNPAGGKEMVQAVTEPNHQTHFVLVAFYTGYDDGKQNGYRLWAFPKARCTYEQFMELGRKILNPSDDKIKDIGLFWGQSAFPSN